MQAREARARDLPPPLPPPLLLVDHAHIHDHVRLCTSILRCRWIVVAKEYAFHDGPERAQDVDEVVAVKVVLVRRRDRQRPRTRLALALTLTLTPAGSPRAEESRERVRKVREYVERVRYGGPQTP